MPIPKIEGARPVSVAETTQPFSTPTLRPGSAGLNLRKTIDALETSELAIMKNLTWTQEGGLSTRAGIKQLTDTGESGTVHTILSMRDPAASAHIDRLCGVGTSLYMATFPQTGSAPTTMGTAIKSSYFSGQPLIIVPYRPPLSGKAWAFIADSGANENTKMVKVATDGTVREIGLPFPRNGDGTKATLDHSDSYYDPHDGGSPDRAVYWGREGKTSLLFDKVEDTWFAGTDGTWYAKQGIGEGPPEIERKENDSTNRGPHVKFVTTKGDQASTDFFSFAVRQVNPGVDFTKVTQTGGVTAEGGPLGPVVRDATDDDQVTFWMKVSEPRNLTEVRIYLLVDPPSMWADVQAGNGLPGYLEESGDDLKGSMNAYVKAIRPGDLTQFYSGRDTAESVTGSIADRRTDEAIIKQINKQLEYGPSGHLDEQSGEIINYNPTGPDQENTQQSGGRGLPAEGASGRHEWVQFGVAGNSLRRGDFRRIGSDTTRGWEEITGVAVYVGCKAGTNVAIYLQRLYLTGGAGPDTVEPGAVGYDYRYTHFDRQTGTESNGSGVLPDSKPYGIFPNRRSLVIKPFRYGSDGRGSTAASSHIVQKFYRRGGSLGNHWYYVGKNTLDGEAFEDLKTDAEITLAKTIPTGNAQPVTTVDHEGAITLAVPLKAFWGPVQDTLFGCGDPYRPGHLYWSNPGSPDHWSPYNALEVCSPSEELMHGGFFGGQVFVFSRERMYWVYPNLTGDGTVTATPSGCTKGLFTRTGLAIGSAGIFFVNRDGIWRTNGGEAQLLSAPIGDEDDGGLFSERDNVNLVYRRIDWNDSTDIRLEVWGTELWFQYRDKGGENNHLIWDSLSNRWKWYQFTAAGTVGNIGTIYADTTQHRDKSTMLLGGRAGGKLYSHEKLDDAGGNINGDDTGEIAARLRTGAWDVGRGRERKLFGDVFVDMDRDEAEITVQATLDNWTVDKSSQRINSGTGRTQHTLDPFGDHPGRGQNIALDLSWGSASRRPSVQQLGVSTSPEPEETKNRATRWDDLGSAEEKYVTGVMVECDTGGLSKSFVVESVQGNDTTTVKTCTVDTSGSTTRQRRFFSWPAVQADRIRLRATDDVAWTLYECAWVAQQEPPRLAEVDSHFEVQTDSYYTGLDLVINTFNQAKTFNIYVDDTKLTNPATGTTDFSVQTNGRRMAHLSFGPGRGHVYRFVATDASPCLLYSHKWLVEQEPTETANWNQNWTLGGTHADKYVKGVKLECDTFGAAKTVIVEIDGTTAATLTVNTPDRRVVHAAFAQVRGRIVRIRATDNNPGRLYTASLIFDEEPLGLDRWETQELNLGSPGWKALLEGWVTYRSSEAVTMQVTAMREDGTSQVKTYTLPDTTDVKRQHYLTFEAVKGVQFKFLFTSDADFWLYRPESVLKVVDWGGQVRGVQPFGDDDLDLVRSLRDAQTGASNPYKSMMQGRTT